MPNKTYEVGYKKPPKKTRFRKGQSGNAKGRPKESKNISTIFEDTLSEIIIITENGQRKEISKLEAIIKQAINKAASGEFRFMQYVISKIPSNGLFVGDSIMEAHNKTSPEEVEKAHLEIQKFLDDYAALKRKSADLPPTSE